MSRYLIKTAIYGMLMQGLFFAAALFIPALTIYWWKAWVIIAVTMLSTGITVLTVFPGREDLLRERTKPLAQEGQPLVDKILVSSFLASYIAVVIFIPLDIFHWHILPTPHPIVSAAGLALYIIGWIIISLCFKDNAFTAPVVKHQKERHHVVVDAGVYGIVRHPIYSGFNIYGIGLALWLDSYAAAIAMVLPIVLLMFRILNEEKFLKKELTGYEDYTKRVRYRLIPYVW